MAEIFNTIATPGFERDIKSLVKKKPSALKQILKSIDILKIDPYNRSRSHDIKKLTAVAPGEGQFRLRSGNYRLRYDIFGNDVVIYSARDRKEAY